MYKAVSLSWKELLTAQYVVLFRYVENHNCWCWIEVELGSRRKGLEGGKEAKRWPGDYFTFTKMLCALLWSEPVCITSPGHPPFYAAWLINSDMFVYPLIIRIMSQMFTFLPSLPPAYPKYLNYFILHSGAQKIFSVIYIRFGQKLYW